MIYPNFLKKGDLIEVPAPSDGSKSEQDINRYNNAKMNLEKKGYKIELSKNIINSINARSADAVTRAKELNKMFESNSNILMCASGGEFLVETLPFIDFSKLANNPKWIVGFSDPTGLLFTITTKYDIATMYGNNFKSYGAEKLHKSLEDNLKILEGNLIEQESYEKYEEERLEKITGLEGYNLTQKVQWKTLSGKEEKIKGRIIGGCIDIITELLGTRYDNINNFIEKYKEDGIIWYFDNCELFLEELIRLMWKFEELGYFKYTKGIIWGRNGVEMSHTYNSMEETLRDSSVLTKLNVPVMYDTDISHKGPSMTIINGAIAEITCKDGKGSVKFELK